MAVPALKQAYDIASTFSEEKQKKFAKHLLEDIQQEKVPNAETIQAIKETRKGINTKTFNTVEELFEDLED